MNEFSQRNCWNYILYFLICIMEAVFNFISILRFPNTLDNASTQQLNINCNLVLNANQFPDISSSSKMLQFDRQSYQDDNISMVSTV